MKLDKAIEILALNALEEGSYLPPDYIAALKLGIEALKEIKQSRNFGMFDCEKLLPGEDPENG